jgi:type IV pilus assembly protein PilA
MYKNRSKGFTLIELLVVIAIIGILSAVVLASLNTARSKGNDAAIKSNLDTIRTQSAIYYDNANNYGPSGQIAVASAVGTANCATPAGLLSDPNVTAAIKAADAAAGGSGTTATTKVACGIGAGWATWSFYAPLSTGGGWCVDSTGKSASSTAPSASSCP